MRKALYSIGVLAFLGILTLGLYGSYKISDMRRTIDHLESTLEAREAEARKTAIEPQAQCTYEKYDTNTGNLSGETTGIPENFVGMERAQLSSYLSQQKTPYYQYSLVAYSPDYVVIRESRTSYGTYYLKLEKGKVNVYKDGTRELYESTQIDEKSLPDKLKEELTQGKYLDSEEELYGFMENYSS